MRPPGLEAASEANFNAFELVAGLHAFEKQGRLQGSRMEGENERNTVELLLKQLVQQQFQHLAPPTTNRPLQPSILQPCFSLKTRAPYASSKLRPDAISPQAGLGDLGL